MKTIELESPGQMQRLDTPQYLLCNRVTATNRFEQTKHKKQQ